MEYGDNVVLGIDVGGTGLKAAPVNIDTGELLHERVRALTPQPATPEAVVDKLAELAAQFDWKGPIGVGFPSIMKNGVALTAANIDKSWIGCNVEELIAKKISGPVNVINDADAAGLAELAHGVAKGNNGLVMMITIGTGIGSALFSEGKLIPNTELGHIYLPNGVKAEKYCSNVVRKNLDLSWEEWGNRFNEYLVYLERLFTPDLFILGGGASKKFDKYEHLMTTTAPVKPAELLNAAGCIGAAMALKPEYASL